MKHRPIKFRAWHTDEYPVESLQLTMMPHEQLSIDGCLDCARYGTIILMQFTGFLDKRGQEIYEGDILSTTYIDCFSNETVIILNQVTFERGSFGVIGEVTGKFMPFDEYLDINEKGVCDAEIVANACTHQLIKNVLYSLSDRDDPVALVPKCRDCTYFSTHSMVLAA